MAYKRYLQLVYTQEFYITIYNDKYTHGLRGGRDLSTPLSLPLWHTPICILIDFRWMNPHRDGRRESARGGVTIPRAQLKNFQGGGEVVNLLEGEEDNFRK